MMISNRKQVLAAVLLLALVAAPPAARGTILDVFLQPIDNSSGGPALSGYTTYDLMLQTGTDWLSTGMFFDLRAATGGAGSFYQESAPFGSNTTPNPGFFDFRPTLPYDTFVTIPGNYPNPPENHESVNIAGGVSELGGSGTLTFSTEVLEIAWFDTVNTGPGTYALARITLSANATGTMTIKVGTANPGGSPYEQTLTNTITGGVWAGDIRVAGDPPPPPPPPATDPAQITVTAAGALLAPGETVGVANSAAAEGRERDAALLSGVAVSTDAAFGNRFSIVGDFSSGQTIAPGASRTATIAFDGSGLLNATVVGGQFSFEVTGADEAAHGQATGDRGPHSFALQAQVSGNAVVWQPGATWSDPLTAPVGAGGSYAGLSSGTEPGSGLLGSTATLLAGENQSGSPTTVSMQWRARTAAEQTLTGGGLISDVVDLTGIAGNSPKGPFVLQMTYDADALLQIWDLTVSEAIAQERLYLAFYDEDADFWMNAVSGNTAVGGDAQTNVVSSWDDFAAAQSITPASLKDFLGSWGVDVSQSAVWAVLDHNSQFAAVPEPSALLLTLLGGLALALAYRRRQR